MTKNQNFSQLFFIDQFDVYCKNFLLRGSMRAELTHYYNSLDKSCRKPITSLRAATQTIDKGYADKAFTKGGKQFNDDKFIGK